MAETRGAAPLLVRGGLVLAMDDAGTRRIADVRVRGGYITEVASDLAPEPGERVIDASGCVVLPGFVQTHIHLCQTLFRNLADDLPLLDWLARRIWPLEASHTAESLRASADLGIAELLLGGTTAIVDMGTVRHTDVVLDALVESGLRAVAGKCMMDAPDGYAGLREPTEASLRESLDLAARWDGAGDGRVRYGFAPRFVLSCTDGLLADVAAEARRLGAFVHTHASENPEETAIVRARSGGEGNVAFLARLGIRGPRTVVAHCVHLDPSEVVELAEAGTRVSHCPSSNLKLGSGIADVPGMLDAGVHVTFGADGAPCNNRIDMWTEMRTAALIHKPRRGADAMPATTVLRMATRGGAEAIGRAADLGQVAPGFLADLQVVALDPLLHGPGGDPVSALVYAAARDAVRTVVVQGRVLVDDGALVALDRDDVVARARRELDGCRARAAL